MKTRKQSFLAILIVIMIFHVSVAFAANHDYPTWSDTEQKDRYNFLQGTSVARELIEWGLIGGVYYVSDFYLDDLAVWPDKPLLSTEYKYFESGEDFESTVESEVFYVAGAIIGTSILLLPNDEGWLNHTSYRHFKGFTEASLAVNPFVTEIAKLSTGKKRPLYYDQLENDPDLEQEDIDDLRKSFWSGHASTSFTMATYFNLFLYNNVADNTKQSLVWKVPLSVGTYGLATYVASTRVTDHKHDVLDVTVGGIAGSLVATFVYGLHENWFGKFYHDEDRSVQRSERRRSGRQVSLQVYPGGIWFVKRF